MRQGWFDPSSGVITVGMIGRFSSEMRPDRFLRVFASAARRVPGLRAVMVGEGPLLNECRRLAQALQVGGRILFSGFRADAAAVYEALDILVIPACGEGLPAALLGGMKRGVPVVAARAGAVAAVVRDGESALLADEGDEAALEEALVRLAGDGALRRRLAEAARVAAREWLAADRRRPPLAGHAPCLRAETPIPDARWE